jgi:hypothetical protein
MTRIDHRALSEMGELHNESDAPLTLDLSPQERERLQAATALVGSWRAVLMAGIEAIERQEPARRPPTPPEEKA